MEIQCEQQVLLKGVQTVSRAISSRTTMPILGNILLETTKDGLRLAATDLELAMETWIKAEVSEGGALTLPSRLLGEIMANLPEAAVKLRVQNGGAQAEITCERAGFEVLGLPANDFPFLPELDQAVVATVESGLLRGMIRQTVFAVSGDETRPFLTGEYLVVDEDELRLVATDGSRLALRTAALSTPARQKLAAIVPAKALHELARVLGAVSGDVTIGLAENQLVFAVPEVRLVSRLISGQFPNYQQVIPKSHKQRLQLSTQEFLRAVRRAAITARDSANVVRLNAGADGLVITSNTPEVGKAVEKVTARSEGEPVEVAFNARYLLDCLNVLESDELTFELTGSQSPGAIKTPAQPDYIYVLAPVRVYN